MKKEIRNDVCGLHMVGRVELDLEGSNVVGPQLWTVGVSFSEVIVALGPPVPHFLSIFLLS